MDVQPGTQNIDALFSNTTYYIDFYQRQYKWTDVPVKRLLDDVFYKFNLEYTKHKGLSLPIDQVASKYAWYYLSTYVTNKIDEKLYVVDGQQRLTTLTLILFKLKHLAKHFTSKLDGWIGQKIVGLSGYKTDFWMNHEAHKAAMQALYDGGVPWEGQVSTINAFKEDEIDQFFTYFLKAKFADTIGEGRRYDVDYHRVIFSENKLNLDHNASEVTKFLQNDFKYYTNLYAKVLGYYSDDSLANGFSHVYFNGLTGG